MDVLRALKERISVFPGYLGEENRRLADGLVRSYLGEALAILAARLLPPDPAVQDALGALLFRAGFRNQRAFRAFEYATLDGVRVEAIGRCDLRLVDLAERTASVETPELAAFLDEVAAAFDARDLAMESIGGEAPGNANASTRPA